MVVYLVIIEVRKAQRGITVEPTPAFYVLPDLYQLSGVLHCRRTKERGIHKAENRSVHADAQSQGKRNHDGKGRGLTQHAQSVANILNQSLHSGEVGNFVSW